MGCNTARHPLEGGVTPPDTPWRGGGRTEVGGWGIGVVGVTPADTHWRGREGRRGGVQHRQTPTGGWGGRGGVAGGGGAGEVGGWGGGECEGTCKYTSVIGIVLLHLKSVFSFESVQLRSTVIR